MKEADYITGNSVPCEILRTEDRKTVDFYQLKVKYCMHNKVTLCVIFKRVSIETLFILKMLLCIMYLSKQFEKEM
ncbi:hypothetical protein T4D_10115 [Trichinella pseudospiralis]|uniref:Uncharacterized protein n=1 Tax=Trichinella pseudospiralis TaxID=6337 RepID=A0A0V1FCP3_TRIPS|nr:hypothetical protein T4D_10115 [Trichinella pseudospiralis]